MSCRRSQVPSQWHRVPVRAKKRRIHASYLKITRQSPPNSMFSTLIFPSKIAFLALLIQNTGENVFLYLQYTAHISMYRIIHNPWPHVRKIVICVTIFIQPIRIHVSWFVGILHDVIGRKSPTTKGKSRMFHIKLVRFFILFFKYWPFKIKTLPRCIIFGIVWFDLSMFFALMDYFYRYFCQYISGACRLIMCYNRTVSNAHAQMHSWFM